MQTDNLAIKEEEEKPCTSAIKQEEETFEDNLMQVEVEIDVNANVDQETEEIKENPLKGERIIRDIDLEEESEIESNDSSFNNYEHTEISEDDSSAREEFKTKDKQNKDKKKIKDGNKVKKKKSHKGEKKNNTTTTKKKWTDKFLDPILTEQMIKKHINMICDLCVFVGSSFPDMVTHFKKYHPKVRPYIMCCERKFTKRYYVAQHALKHEDPNYFR